MKKIVLIIMLSSSILVISACNKNVSGNNLTTSNTVNSVNTVSNNSSENNSEEINSPKGNNTNMNSNTITDINSWDHPVKYVFRNANIQVEKVDFKNDKTYPIFYVILTKNIEAENKMYYTNLINQVATANGYWDYEINDTQKNVDIKVVCDRSTRNVKQIIYNKDSNYFVQSESDKSSIDNTDNELSNYLINNVSEVKSFVDSLKNNENAKGIVYVERYPDKNSSNIYIRDYYGLYVGEEHSDHNVNIYRFAINKDTKDILYYDVVNDKYESLSDWRKNR